MIRRIARRLLSPLRPPPVRVTADGAAVRVPGVGRFDLRLHATGDRWISDAIRSGLLLEPLVTRALQALVRPGDTLLDVGGNIGWFAVIGSRLVGPSGRVITVEPEPANAAVLRENIRRNGCANAELLEIAAGAADGTARLYRSPDNSGDHRLGASAEGREAWVDVPVRRLDAAVSGRVDVLKMDTQGSEVAALTGMEGLLAANPAMRMVIEFWPHGLATCGSDTAALMALLAARPRRYWLMDHRSLVVPTTPERILALAAGEYAPETQLHGDIVALAETDAEGIGRMRALETR
jgi:FkbM family methyltransferase